jgi:hypothetical protein
MMRFLSLQSPKGLPHVRMLYEELAKHDMLVDAVVAPVEKGRVEKLARDDRGFTGVFAHDEWIVPLTECAIKQGLCVVVFLKSVPEWYELEESGLVRQVDLFVFESYDLYNKLNRNLNHVVVEDLQEDAPVLVAVLGNIAGHHKYRRPSVKEIRRERTKATALVKKTVEMAYQEKPSFTELHHFLDAMHSENERQRLILNLRTLLARRAPVREIRGLADPPRVVKEVQDGA